MDKKKFLNLKNIYQKNELENGLKYICSPNKFHNTCSIVFLVRVGSRNEKPTEYGLAHYLEHMLFKGNRKYPHYQDLNKKIDSIHAQTNASTHKNYTMYYLKLPSSNFKEGLELLREMVFFSTLDSKELEKEKEVVIEEINKNYDDSLDYAHDMLETNLFGKHSLAHFILGTKNNIRKLNRKQLLGFYHKYYLVNNCCVSLGGNVPSNYHNIINEVLGKLKPKKIQFNFIDFKSLVEKPKIVCHPRKQEQISIVLGFPTMKENDMRKYVLDVISHILYGNMTSRLWLKLRDNNPIVYGLETYIELFEEGGYFSIDLSLSKKNLEKTIRILFEELTKLKNKLVGLAELNLVKKKMISDLEEEDDDNLDISTYYGEKYLLDLNLTTFSSCINIIRKITPKQVRDICRELFDFNKCTLIQVGNVSQSELVRLVKKYFTQGKLLKKNKSRVSLKKTLKKRK